MGPQCRSSTLGGADTDAQADTAAESCLGRYSVGSLCGVAAGIDVLFDPVGGVPFTEALKTLKWGAQIAIIGFASGTIPKVRCTLPFQGCCSPTSCLVKSFCSGQVKPSMVDMHE